MTLQPMTHDHQNYVITVHLRSCRFLCTRRGPFRPWSTTSLYAWGTKGAMTNCSCTATKPLPERHCPYPKYPIIAVSHSSTFRTQSNSRRSTYIGPANACETRIRGNSQTGISNNKQQQGVIMLHQNDMTLSKELPIFCKS